jgi:DNA repair exonuclease SbcCD ATPase subunit
MSFKIKNLTVKNFMSVGNATQAVNFDRKDLTLVLGENLDLGGDDSGARNGTGKTSIANALSYAFFGQALTSIKKDNLINKTNAKNMLVTIDFEKDGTNFKIERGRRPGILTLYKGDVAFAAKDNDAQGDSRETQAEIDRIICMSHDMFRHVVALNTYTEPFLALRANDQRTIIEQLLGITMLSEKAEALKECVKDSKELITKEEYGIKAKIEANKKIEEQVAALKRRCDLWTTKHSEDVSKLQTDLANLQKIDIDAEINAHENLAAWTQLKKDLADLKLVIDRGNLEMDRESKGVIKLLPEIAALEDHKCHACGQDIHDDKQAQILSVKTRLLQEHEERVVEISAHLDKSNAEYLALGTLGVKPETHYAKAEGAFNHRATVEHLQTQLEAKLIEVNPYSEQITEMETTALAEIDYGIINSTVRLKEHQEFLLKLLTNKDSFIRKRIIDQNLTYLNSRLSWYLDKIGLPHTVVFQSDLSVEITELGRELDFDNLSRGERGRLILSLSWAFRDVWESLYEPINLLFIDELIDNGLDTSGVESAMGILKKMGRDSHKSVWLVSHKDELVSRVNNILHVVKEGGFTAYNSDAE